MCLVVLRCGCSPGGDLLGREICRTGADGFGSVDPGRCVRGGESRPGIFFWGG